MMREFNLLLPGIFDKDKSGHLFIADIEFDEDNANEKKLLLMKFILQFLKKENSFTRC